MDTHDLVISTEGLGKSFDEVHALKSLDLRVPQKSIFAFLGTNGAGKTTTIKLLLGLLKPTRGGGKILGMDIVRDSVDIRARIGYLPQDTRFYEHMTARQTLAYTAQFFYAGPQSEINKRVNEMIELVGLEGKADRPIKSFSGGERQRLGIAQAEINYPDLLILDEPAASLDPQGRRDVLEVMSRLSKHSTIFYCTHILDDVQKVSDRVAIVNQGKLVKQAPIQELLSGAGDVTYAITLTGDAQNAYTQVNQQQWVSGVESKTKDGQTTWFVSVTDESAAKDRLLNLLISNGLNVLNFSRKEQNLEDVFLNIIEGSRK
ncbi:MAG: putative ABC transporter ATP-binding protein YxlF [Anaerolineales bacterium]|nr:putative ABC transporter ATP-binding protein YxlF [Anaerolineales bacterium]